MHSYSKLSDATLLDLQRDRFEVLLKQPTNTAYRPGRLRTFFTTCFRQMGQSFVNWMTHGSAPKITKQAQGDTEIWQVYDPVTNRTLYFDHEDALRVWIDQRYYQ